MIWLTACIPPAHDVPNDPRTFSPSSRNALDIGKSLPYFRTYMEAMRKVHLDNLLIYEDPVTVFMPNNTAFSKFYKAYGLYDYNSLNEEELRRILSYHIIRGRYSTPEMTTGYYPTYVLESTTGNPVDIYVDMDGIFRLNGESCMDTPDLLAVNGMVHSITTVIMPADILTLLSVNPYFSFFRKMISRTDLGLDYEEMLASDGPFTLVIPDDKAVRSYIGAHSEWLEISDFPAEVLKSFLQHHILIGHNFLLNNIRSDSTLGSGTDAVYSVDVTGFQKKIVDGSGRPAGIVIADIQATNGVIQVVDQFILTD